MFRTRNTAFPTRKTLHGTRNTSPGGRNNVFWTQNTVRPGRKTVLRTLNTVFWTRKALHGTRNTSPGGRNNVFRAQNTVRPGRKTVLRTLNTVFWTRKALHGTRNTSSGGRNNAFRAQNTVRPGRKTVFRTQNTAFPTRKTLHGTRNTSPGGRNNVFWTQDNVFRTACTLFFALQRARATLEKKPMLLHTSGRGGSYTVAALNSSYHGLLADLARVQVELLKICSAKSFAKHLVDERDGDRALSHGRGDAFDVAAPHVADREHSGKVGFEEKGSPRERPLRGGQVFRRQVRSGPDEALRVERDTTIEPVPAGTNKTPPALTFTGLA